LRADQVALTLGGIERRVGRRGFSAAGAATRHEKHQQHSQKEVDHPDQITLVLGPLNRTVENKRRDVAATFVVNPNAVRTEAGHPYDVGCAAIAIQPVGKRAISWSDAISWGASLKS